MLYNKSTGKTDVMSLDSLIAWLETKPSNGAYNYMTGGRCLIAQYFTAKGYTVHGCGAGYIRITPEDRDDLTHFPKEFEAVALGNIKENDIETLQLGWTFGKALARAKRAKTAKENA